VLFKVAQKTILKMCIFSIFAFESGSKNVVDTPLIVTLNGILTSNINNNISMTFQAGDCSISVKITIGSSNATTDTVVQVDIFYVLSYLNK
jgi:predicted nicotinamide N-methyase